MYDIFRFSSACINIFFESVDMAEKLLTILYANDYRDKMLLEKHFCS